MCFLESRNPGEADLTLMERAVQMARIAIERELVRKALRDSEQPFRLMVEGVKDKRVLTDGARTVEIHHIAGVLHDDGLLMVYLPKEKLLVQADTFTPVAAGTAPPMPPSPFNVGLADNITRLGLAVDNHLPLHGRMVPMAELNRAIGK